MSLRNQPPEENLAAETENDQKADQEQETDSEKAASSADESKSHSSAQSGKPVFEFDSVEPNDIKLTEEDLDVIENMTSNSLVLQDFDSMVMETFPGHDRSRSTSSETTETQATEKESESDDGIPNGSDTGKCYRWSGKAVLPTIELVEQQSSELQCFDIQENVNLVPCSFVDIKQAVNDKDGPKIFVLTKKGPDELRSFFTAKRWNERIGHPQALSMFLTLLPSKNIKLLFAEIDACILVQKNDIELVRLSRDLKK